MTTPEQKDEAFISGLYSTSMFAAFGVVLSSLGIFAAQILGWLRYGAWPAVSAADVYHWIGLPSVHFRWIGVQKIFVLVGELPGAFVVFLSGLGLALWFTSLADEHDRALREAKFSRQK